MAYRQRLVILLWLRLLRDEGAYMLPCHMLALATASVAVGARVALHTPGGRISHLITATTHDVSLRVKNLSDNSLLEVSRADHVTIKAFAS